MDTRGKVQLLIEVPNGGVAGLASPTLPVAGHRFELEPLCKNEPLGGAPAGLAAASSWYLAKSAAVAASAAEARGPTYEVMRARPPAAAGAEFHVEPDLEQLWLFETPLSPAPATRAAPGELCEFNDQVAGVGGGPGFAWRLRPEFSALADARAAASAVARWARSVCLLLALAVPVSAALAADTPVSVAPGAEVRIDASDKPMVNKSTVLKGTVTLDQQGQAPAIHRLMYTAPAEAKAELTETIRYEKDGVMREASVRVPKAGDDGTYASAFKILVQLFLVAVLLEQALSAVFNWRPFLENFNARGVKTVISVVVAYLVVHAFRLDFFRDLVNAYTQEGITSDFASEFLTAMILAGGSSGVNNLLIALGFRSMRSADQIVPKPPHKEAWIAVRLIRDKAVGSVTASIGTKDSEPSVAGIITGVSPKNRLLRSFLVDRGRFPIAGGYALQREDGKSYFVQLDGVDAQGQPLPSVKWGPYPIAPAALIDLDLKL